MFFLLLITNALASTGSGLGLTPLGGGMSGITEPGALGIPITPSAAQSDSLEVVLDAGANIFRFGATLEGTPREEYKTSVPMPYLGMTVPIGDFGVGVYGMIPYGGGIELEDNSAHRFHSIESRSYLIEMGVPVAYSATDWLKLGASVRFGFASLNKRSAMNTAALVNSSVDLDPPLPTDNTLLVGEQDLKTKGYGVGFGLGASVLFENDVELHLGYRSPMKVGLSGPVNITPFNDIELAMSGEAEGTIQFATEVELGVVVPIANTRLALQAGWVDWTPFSQIDIRVQNLSVQSDRSAVESLLVGTGINESDLLKSGTEIRNNLGHTSVFHGGGTLGIPIGDKWEVRPGAFYSPTTLPDDGFHAGIADFTSWDLRLVGSYQLNAWLTTGLSYDYFMVKTRTIRTSSLSFENDAASGRVLPSANGRYDMTANRVGLSLIARM